MIRKKKEEKNALRPRPRPLVGVLLTPYFSWVVPKMRSAECGVRVKQIKKNTINKYNSKEIKNSLSEKQKLWLITELKHHIHKQPDKTIRRARLM